MAELFSAFYSLLLSMLEGKYASTEVLSYMSCLFLSNSLRGSPLTTQGRVQPILARCIGLTLALDTLSPSRQGRRASKASARAHRIRNDCRTQYSLHGKDQADIYCEVTHAFGDIVV